MRRALAIIARSLLFVAMLASWLTERGIVLHRAAAIQKNEARGVHIVCHGKGKRRIASGDVVLHVPIRTSEATDTTAVWIAGPC
jgi:hypothetical protein